MVRSDASSIMRSAVPTAPALIVGEDATAPPTAPRRQQRMIGAALPVDGGHFVSHFPDCIQNTSATALAVSAIHKALVERAACKAVVDRRHWRAEKDRDVLVRALVDEEQRGRLPQLAGQPHRAVDRHS